MRAVKMDGIARSPDLFTLKTDPPFEKGGPGGIFDVKTAGKGLIQHSSKKITHVFLQTADSIKETGLSSEPGRQTSIVFAVPLPG